MLPLPSGRRPSFLARSEMSGGRSNDGKISAVEDTSPLDDDYDVNIRLAGSGVVYDIARPYTSAGGTCKRCDWSYDRCICGVAGSRKGKG